MNIEIRENGTFEEIKKVLSKLSRKEYQFLFSRNTFIDSPHAKVRLIAYADNELAGFLEGYIFPESPEAIVVTVAVLSRFRGEGIATRLVRRMEEIAIRLNVKYVVWRADKINTASTSLAASLGYALVKDDGVQVRYEKTIKKGRKTMNAFEQIQMECVMAAQEAIFFSTDKSRSKKIENFAAIDKAIRVNIEMIEKWVAYTNEYLKFIPTAPNTVEGQKERGIEYGDKCNQFDYERGTTKELQDMTKAYIRNRRRILDRADMKKSDVQEAEKALLMKLVKGGEYARRLGDLVPKLDKIREQVDAGWKKYDGQTYYMRSYNTIAHFYNWYIKQWAYTMGDTKAVMEISKKHGVDAAAFAQKTTTVPVGKDASLSITVSKG